MGKWMGDGRTRSENVNPRRFLALLNRDDTNESTERLTELSADSSRTLRESKHIRAYTLHYASIKSRAPFINYNTLLHNDGVFQRKTSASIKVQLNIHPQWKTSIAIQKSTAMSLVEWVTVLGESQFWKAQFGVSCIVHCFRKSR